MIKTEATTLPEIKRQFTVTFSGVWSKAVGR
jgi:hypothetical protein